MTAIAPRANFSHLPYELRSMIWTFAVDAQIRHIAKNLPNHRLSSEKAERQRQAFLAYHLNQASDQIELPLKLKPIDFFDGSRIFYDEDDFQTFIHSLPMSAVCREARLHAGRFCRTAVQHIVLDYCPVDAAMTKEFTEDRKLMNDPDIVALRARCMTPKIETLERFQADPTSLIVYAEMRTFRSPEHLTQVVNRFFGNKVERLILDFYGDCDARYGEFWGDDHNDDGDGDGDGDSDSSIDFVIRWETLNFRQKVHAVNETIWDKYGWHSQIVARYLVIFYDIIEKNLETLPHLKRISLDLLAQGLSQSFIWIDSFYKDGVLSASLEECDTEGDVEVVEDNDWEDD